MLAGAARSVIAASTHEHGGRPPLPPRQLQLAGPLKTISRLPATLCWSRFFEPDVATALGFLCICSTR
jgi:hypothetical protein